MSIKGTKYWNAKDRYYSQENNPMENFLKLKLLAKEKASWLETCGPTAAINCMSAMGFFITITTPGGYKPQPEAILMDHMVDPNNAKKFKDVRDLKSLHIPGNRVPQYYPLAVKEVFGVKATFSWGADWSTLVKEVKNGHAIQLNLKNPGHYIAVVAYDESTNELIYHDSWGSRFSDGKGGRARRLTAYDVTNIKPFRIVYGI